MGIRFSDISYHTRLSLQTAHRQLGRSYKSETPRKWFVPEIIVSNETTTITRVRFPLYSLNKCTSTMRGYAYKSS